LGDDEIFPIKAVTRPDFRMTGAGIRGQSLLIEEEIRDQSG